MHNIRRAVLGFLLFLVLPAGPAAAQEYKGAVGYGAGFVRFGGFADGNDLEMDPGWIAGAQVERWYGTGRLGVRLNGAYTQRPMDIAGTPRDIETWLVDGNVLFRILPVLQARTVVPFISVGAGVVDYGLGEGEPVLIGDAVYPGRDALQPAGVIGLGVDVLPQRTAVFGTPIGFRLEVANHVALESPFEQTNGDSFGPVHNVRVMVSALGLMDLLW